MHLHSVPSLAHAIKQPSTASTPPAVFCKPRLDLHTNQRKYENRHVCWENWKKGGHELNGSTPCCVTQQIPLLIISNTCVTNAKVLSVCVMCLWCPDCGVLYFIPCIYSHARWSYVGDSGLCCCVPCLSSAIIPLCLLIERSFSYTSARFWNLLLDNLRASPLLQTFKA